MPLIDREGTFKARPTTWGLKETDKKALQFGVRFDIIAMWQDGEWHDWTQYGDYFVWGNFTLVGVSGNIIEAQVKSVMAALGWSGSLSELNSGDWSQCEVKVTVKENIYKDEVSFRAEWMNPVDGGPSISNVEDGRLKQLEAQFGSKFRALRSVAGTPAPPKRTARNVAAAVMAENPPPPPIGTTMDPTDTRTNPHALPADDFPDL